MTSERVLANLWWLEPGLRAQCVSRTLVSLTLASNFAQDSFARHLAVTVTAESRGEIAEHSYSPQLCLERPVAVPYRLKLAIAA